MDEWTAKAVRAWLREHPREWVAVARALDGDGIAGPWKRETGGWRRRDAQAPSHMGWVANVWRRLDGWAFAIYMDQREVGPFPTMEDATAAADAQLRERGVVLVDTEEAWAEVRFPRPEPKG